MRSLNRQRQGHIQREKPCEKEATRFSRGRGNKRDFKTTTHTKLETIKTRVIDASQKMSLGEMFFLV